MFEELIYDQVRDWIRDQRRDDVSWENIDNPEEDLLLFLKMNERHFHWPHMSEEEWHRLVKLQKESEAETLAIKSQQESATISDQYEENSVTEIPRGRNSSWQTYRRKLILKGFNETSIDEIEEASFKLIKKLSLNTTEIGPRKGLVIGNVQSGKTANMAALMAMAADWGWNMFIVLSGTIENLRKQTSKRLFGDLYNSSCKLNWVMLDQLKANMGDGKRAQDKNFEANQRYMTVCLKNATRLRNLIKWLQEDPNGQNKMKILVIDDEADQAGINTASVQNPQIRKTINKLICALVNGKNFKNEDIDSQYKAMNYIAYTATPYANVLNEESVESLYPKNFISALSVSNEYFGPQQIFGCEDTYYDGLNIIRNVSDDDLNNVKEIHNGNRLQIPNSLRDAVCWFMCTVACQRIWGYTKPVSMLIHTSQKTSHHDYIAKVIYQWIKTTSVNEIIRQCKTLWDYETREFDKMCLREQYCDYNLSDDDIFDYPLFNEVKEQLKILLSGTRISNIPLDQEDTPQYHKGIHLCIDNCKKNGQADGMMVRLMYPEEEQNIARAFIVVGGQTLSRGLTIEGLVSTYFLRSIKQADTLMQMGRWFGYRKGYETLPRIWMTERIKDQYVFLSKLDKKLRDEIRRMEDLGIAPERYGPRVLSHPLAGFLQITARNKRQKAIITDYTGVASQTIIFDNNKVTLEENLEQTKNFLSSLPAPEEHKNCNNHSAHSIVWKNVEFGIVRKYLESFHYSTQQSAFNDINRMMKWFETITQSGKLGKWNIVLAGVGPEKASGYWLPFKVAKVCRTNKKQHKHNTLNIGTLRVPNDVLADVDLEGAPQELISLVRDFDGKNVFDIRRTAGLGQTPQLIIYIIDKNSKARTNSKTRENLGAEADVVGLCINVPEDRRRSNDNMVAIPIDNNMFDFIEEIDEENGTDEN